MGLCQDQTRDPGSAQICYRLRYYKARYEILVLVYVQKHQINTHAGISVGARDPSFDLGLHLHSYFVYVNREYSCESAHVL